MSKYPSFCTYTVYTTGQRFGVRFFFFQLLLLFKILVFERKFKAALH